MIVRILFASAHLLALGIGLGAIWTRGRALLGQLDAAGLRRVFAADNFWAAAAGLWLVTGLLRAFAGYEKGSAYYLQSSLFWLKMGLFLAIMLLELRPMIGLIGWRIRLKKGEQPVLGAAHSFAIISHVQAVLLVLMVGVATALARGLG